MKEKLDEKRNEIPETGTRELQRENELENAVIVADLRRLRPDLEENVNNLGVVLEELVKMLDFDGSGVEVYLLHYVAEARLSLRSIVELLEAPSDLHT